MGNAEYMGLLENSSPKWEQRKIPRQAQKPLQKLQRRKKVAAAERPKRRSGPREKTRDKLNNLVLFDKPTYDKLLKEVPTYKLITPSIVSERLKVRGSLARKALAELAQKGLIKQVVQHSAQLIYTRVIKDEADE